MIEDPLDVEEGARAIEGAWIDTTPSAFNPWHTAVSRRVLSAVLPAHDRRLLLALADEWSYIWDADVTDWLLRKANELEVPDD